MTSRAFKRMNYGIETWQLLRAHEGSDLLHTNICILRQREMPNEQSSDAPVIQLTFGPAGSKTWDDQELILAYNEAMSEFHVSAWATSVAPV